jgi:hypothetical protein
MIDFAEAYARHENAVAKANELNKPVIFEALTTAGITSVAGEFDGCGDSGQINDVLAYANENRVEFPGVTLTLHKAGWNQGELITSQTSLSEGVEDLFYGYLEQEHAGWEINDGAYGEFAISVAERTITLEFFARYTDCTKYNYTF